VGSDRGSRKPRESGCLRGMPLDELAFRMVIRTHLSITTFDVGRM
jgi:hypothetical protein